MNIEIISQPLLLDIFGLGSAAVNKDYAGTAFRLSGRMWEIVKTNQLKNKGKNIWVYETADSVFAGIELENHIDNIHGLETKSIYLEKYAYFKHIGPYSLIKQVGRDMTHHLAKNGFEVKLPYIEIYGHWSADESKQETDLIMCLT